MAEEKDEVLETLRRWEDWIFSVFKLIAMIFALSALLILKFYDIEKALNMKAEAVLVQREQSATCPGDENRPTPSVHRRPVLIHQPPYKQRCSHHKRHPLRRGCRCAVRVDHLCGPGAC